MSLTKKFFWLSIFFFFLFTGLGFYLGAYWGVFWYRETFGNPEELMVLSAAIIVGIGAFAGSFIGLFMSLLFIRHLGKKFGEQLNEENELGKHPVLKITVLSFVSFLFLLFLFIYVYGKLTMK